MTVCIAARAGAYIVLASDRMVTQDNIQFEPDRLKITALTNSLFVMTAGDASFSTKLVSALNQRVQKAIAEDPADWLAVNTISDWYVEEYNRVKRAAAEAAVLAPFGLTMDQFLSRQVSFDTSFVERLTDRLYDRTMPSCEAIIAGVDRTGVHIHTVNATEIDVHEIIGFTAIGIGSRHALSHLMQVQHSWNAELNDTVVRAFVAKRRAGTPGVGRRTDMIIVGDALGQSTLVDQEAIGRLDAEYEKMASAERRTGHCPKRHR